MDIQNTVSLVQLIPNRAVRYPRCCLLLLLGVMTDGCGGVVSGMVMEGGVSKGGNGGSCWQSVVDDGKRGEEAPSREG